MYIYKSIYLYINICMCIYICTYCMDSLPPVLWYLAANHFDTPI